MLTHDPIQAARLPLTKSNGQNLEFADITVMLFSLFIPKWKVDRSSILSSPYEFPKGSGPPTYGHPKGRLFSFTFDFPLETPSSKVVNMTPPHITPGASFDINSHMKVQVWWPQSTYVFLWGRLQPKS